MTRDAYCLVVNPGARGQGMRRLPAVLGPLAAAGAQVRVEESSSLGHAATLAAEAAERDETVVAVGGDGTIGAMAAAVSAAGGVLGIIPAGRGNDFARMLGIPADPARAAAVLLRGGYRKVDLIGVAAGDGPQQVIAGSAYLGIPAEGAQLAAASRLPPGRLGYLVAGLRALLAWRPAARPCSSWSSGPRRCWPSRTGRTCSVAARSGWRAPRRSCRPAPSSSSPSSAGAPGGPPAPARAEAAVPRRDPPLTCRPGRPAAAIRA